MATRDSGKAFRDAMSRAGYSKNRLAKESGLAYTTITRMCRGDLNGYVYSWVVACDVMGIDISEVLQDRRSDG